jgi:hypothetical protein
VPFRPVLGGRREELENCAFVTSGVLHGSTITFLLRTLHWAGNFFFSSPPFLNLEPL